MSVVVGIPSSILSLVQDRTLERRFHDALFPALLFRMEAVAERWPVNLGQSQVFTRTGLLPVKTDPLVPGADPQPSSFSTEQWEAVASQLSDTIDTNMTSDYVALASLFSRNTMTLGLNAGETMNRVIRNRIYEAYLSGETVVTVAALAGASVLQVASINGFTQQLENGRLQPVSTLSPISISFSNGEPANTVVAAVPADSANPLGPGTVQLGTPLAGPIPVGAIRVGISSANRARIIRVGGGASVDALSTANIITMREMHAAVALLRANKVPPCADGYYHVHLDPVTEAQIFADNEFQRLHQSLPDSVAYREQAIGQLIGCNWYRNTETPNPENSGTLVDTSGGAGSAQAGSEIHADVINQGGVPIRRTIVMGGGSVMEKYLDESQFITEGGVNGKVGEFTIVNGGVQVMTDRIRYIIRAPQDRLQQVVSQTWSWSGDFPVPSDFTTGNGARYKRAVVIEHA